VSREKLLRELQLKKHEHHMAAQKFGAYTNSNKHRGSNASVTEKKLELSKALDDAARSMVRAEQALEDFDIARRSRSLCAEAV
jgi:hypothetical protein